MMKYDRGHYISLYKPDLSAKRKGILHSKILSGKNNENAEN